MKSVIHSLFWQITAVVLVGLLLAGVLADPIAETFGLPDDGWSRYTAVALPLGALVSLVVYGLYVRRLKRLNRALVENAADGEGLARLPGSSGELKHLAEGVGAMVDTLRNNYEALKQHDELRRSMVANVSHELRTPLTSIQGYLETVRLEESTNPDFGKHVDICIREARHLSRLVQDLFELSKLDTGQLEFFFEPVSLVELSDAVGMAFEQRMEDKGIHFATRFPDDDDGLEIHGDGNRLGQVITNLLNNAVRFTNKGGTITLACARRGELASFSVEDTGVGIPEKDIPHIFESFFHLEKSRTRNLGGTGLGLAISKKIVEKHGGIISVASRVSEGTTFTVDIPIGEAAPAG